MDDAYNSLPSTHLLGSVPAVVPDEKKAETNEGSNANIQTFPPGNGGYQAPGSASGGEEQPATNWRGVFSISLYSPYFNVHTDVVVDRIVSSLYPFCGDFFRKIDANPDFNPNSQLGTPGWRYNVEDNFKVRDENVFLDLETGMYLEAEKVQPEAILSYIVECE